MIFTRLITYLSTLILACNIAYAQPYSLSQYGTLNALLGGYFSGDMTLAELKNKGLYGIGAFNHLDGEFIAVDGQFYRYQADGTPELVENDKQQVPFAMMFPALTVDAIHLNDKMDKPELAKHLDQLIVDKNSPHAIIIKAHFDNILIRTFVKQTPPYADIKQVLKQQQEFHPEHLDGILVGLWFPNYLEDINMPGYHYHFISDDKSIGGHVLYMQLKNAKVQIQRFDQVQWMIPQSKAYQALQLAVDGDELQIEAMDASQLRD